jgi:hypothetical protein
MGALLHTGSVGRTATEHALHLGVLHSAELPPEPAA